MHRIYLLLYYVTVLLGYGVVKQVVTELAVVLTVPLTLADV